MWISTSSISRLVKQSVSAFLFQLMQLASLYLLQLLLHLSRENFRPWMLILLMCDRQEENVIAFWCQYWDMHSRKMSVICITYNWLRWGSLKSWCVPHITHQDHFCCDSLRPKACVWRGKKLLGDNDSIYITLIPLPWMFCCHDITIVWSVTPNELIIVRQRAQKQRDMRL